MAVDEAFVSSGQDPAAVRAEAEARRKAAMDRAMLELPQQVAGIPIYIPPGRDLLTRSIDGKLATPSMVRSELEGLEPGYGGTAVVPSETWPGTTDVIPGPSGPERVAGWIERNYGRLEDKPSWANADQWARAGANWARARDDGGMASPLTSTLADEYHKSQYLMSPARAAYMQGPGRRVDVLRNLRKDPERAMYFWDRSAPPEIRDGRPSDRSLTRTETYDPIYQRFGEDNVTPFIASSSPIARALSWMNTVPAASQFRAVDSPTWSDAFARADNLVLSGDRTRAGANQENPIGDSPDGATPDQIIARQRELDQRAAVMQTPPKENFANSVVGALYDYIPHVSASAWADRPLKEGEEARPQAPLASGLVRDALSFGVNSADGSQLLGLANPRSLLAELIKDTRNEALIEGGFQAGIMGPASLLPEDPAKYVAEGVPSLPIDLEARSAAHEAERKDRELRPQSLYDARNASDPEFGGPMRAMGGRLLDFLRANTPSASAFGGQPAPR